MARPLVLACGALVAELRAVLQANGLTDGVEVRYLPANLHNRPGGIVPGLRELLAERPNLHRLPGNHCYEFFAGTPAFEAMAEAELGTFYLTDFLAKHFEALIWQGLGLDDHPELLPDYFGHYTRLVLLSQSPTEAIVAAGQAAAARLGLRFEHVHTGLGQFDTAVTVVLHPTRKVA